MRPHRTRLDPYSKPTGREWLVCLPLSIMLALALAAILVLCIGAVSDALWDDRLTLWQAFKRQLWAIRHLLLHRLF